MEENTNIPPVAPNTNIKTSSMDSLYKNHPKKTKAIIILAIVLLLILITLYFLNKQKPPKKIYTTEEKVEQINEVVKRTKEQGLPPKEKQLEIMNYNSQE